MLVHPAGACPNHWPFKNLDHRSWFLSWYLVERKKSGNTTKRHECTFLKGWRCKGLRWGFLLLPLHVWTVKGERANSKRKKAKTLKYQLPVFLLCSRMGKWGKEVVKHVLNCWKSISWTDSCSISYSAKEINFSPQSFYVRFCYEA